MAKYFHVALRGTARLWLMNLPPGSVGSWGKLCEKFVTNFNGSFTRPGTHGDVLTIRQRKGETLRQYIQCFSQVRNTIPCISPTAVIMAFSEGVTNKRLVGKLETRTSALGKPRRTTGLNAGAPPRSLRHAMARNLASRRTNRRLPPS